MGLGWRKTAIFSGLCVFWGLVGVVWAFQRLEIRNFPVLSDVEKPWSRYRWVLNGTKLEKSGEFYEISRREDAEETYPGLFRYPLVKNWSQSKEMELWIYWPAENGEKGVIGVRVDDREGNPPYAERFQAEIGVREGWNRVILSEKWLKTPSGGSLNTQNITKWGIFIISSPKTNYFGLGQVRLR